MTWLGYRPANSVVYIPFTTHSQAGAAVAPSTAFEAADVRLYKNGSATERSSQAGWTMTSPFDSVTGLHVLAIDLSDNTDSGFYAAGSHYIAVLVPNDETVDGLSVVRVIGSFDIGPAETNVVQWRGSQPNALVSSRVDASVGAMANDVLTATAIANNAIANAKIADGAISQTKVANGFINQAKIVDGSFTNAKFADGAISAGKIADGALTAAKFASGAFDAVWSVTTRLLTAGTNIVLAKGTGVTGFNDLSAAQVNAEVVDALNVDTYAEPASVPAATASIQAMVHWVFTLARNKVPQNSTTQTVRNDADDADIASAPVSDSSGTFTRGKFTS